MNYSPWFLLAAVPVFALVVLIHELGHFIVAKRAGIRVDEFAIGFPPRLASIKRGETTYSLNLLPIGGYVRMPGENGETTDEQGNFDPRSFGAKPAGVRAAVLIAGVTMNFLLAIVLFSAAEAVGTVEYPPVIGSVEQSSPAQAAGLKPGDRILAVNGQPVQYYTDVQRIVSTEIQQNAQAQTVPVTLEVQRPSAQRTFTTTLQARVKPPSGQGAIGVSFAFDHPISMRPPLWKAPLLGVQDIGRIIVVTGQLIGQIVAGTISAGRAVQGPVGIVTTTAAVASSVSVLGWYNLLFLVGYISLNLAVVNLLPIPGLDGGRLLFVVIEWLRRGKRVSPEREGLVHLIGFMVLLLLIAVVTFNDVSNLGR